MGRGARRVGPAGSAAGAIALALVLAQACAALSLRATHTLRLRSHPLWALTTALLFVALAWPALRPVSTAAPRRRAIGHRRFEVGAAALRRVGAAPLLYGCALALLARVTMARVFSDSWRIPTSFSVDVAHHGAIAAWLYAHADFPRTYDPQLLTFSLYPNAAHAPAAQLAWVAHTPPFTALWWTALSFVLTTWLCCALIVRSIDRSWRAALVPPVLCLVAWRYTLGIINWDFFYAQFAAITWGLAATALTVWSTDRRAPLRRWLPAVLVLASASVLAFPQHAPIAIAMLTAAASAGRRAERGASSGRRRQQLRIAVPAATVLTIGLVVVGRQIGVRRSMLDSASEGAEVARLSWRSLGGPLPVLLAAVGAVLLAAAVVRRADPRAAALLGAGAGPLALSAAFFALDHGFPVRVPVSSYRMLKNVYAIVPFALAAAGVAVGSAVRRVLPLLPSRLRLSWRRGAGALTTAGALVTGCALLVTPPVRALTWRPVVPDSTYRFALHVARRYDVEQVGLAGPRLQPYVLWWTGLRRRVTFDAYPQSPLMVRWDAWPAARERYLLVSGAAVSTFAARPGVRVVERAADAALLERTDR